EKDQWVLVASKNAGRLFTDQVWRTHPEFPAKEIKELWDKGYRITDISYGNGQWALVMSKGTGLNQQMWNTGDEFPGKKIEEYWNKGHNIYKLTYENKKWLLIMAN
ncbi:MAG TPA: hypothetical protein PKE63_13850, partial [Lacibacter sp.]|nr:hypothetical protein [Lacibacter sp.]